MTRTLSFYDLATGHFTGKQVRVDGEAAEVIPPQGIGLIEGSYDRQSQRVDLATGRVVDHRPPAPSDEYWWDERMRRWQVKAEVANHPDRRRTVMERIRTLEASQGRAVREATLGDATALRRLRDIDDTIRTLRTELSSG